MITVKLGEFTSPFGLSLQTMRPQIHNVRFVAVFESIPSGNSYPVGNLIAINSDLTVFFCVVNTMLFIGSLELNDGFYYYVTGKSRFILLRYEGGWINLGRLGLVE